MFDEKHYVPILKWKRGEAKALEELAPDVKKACTPVIEVIPIPFDYNNGTEKKTLAEHLADSIEMLAAAWGSQPTFIDLRLLPGAKVANGKPLTATMHLARKAGVAGIPVVSTSSTPDVLAAAAVAHQTDGRGICLRERANDVAAPKYGAIVTAALRALGTTPASVDLIVDLQDVSTAKFSLMQAAVPGLIQAVPHMKNWRSFTLASTAFPINLSGIAHGVQAIQRADWALWTSLNALPRSPTYGDYGVSHWDFVELDMRFIRTSASIRYTSDLDWIIFRGRNVNAHGFGQYATFSKQLVKHAAYSGPAFSVGDAEIEKRASTGQSGNHETWRRIATNHHITFVVNQLATKAASSAPGAPGSAAGSL